MTLPKNRQNIEEVNRDLGLVYEVEREQAQRFCEIIDLMVQLIDKVDGHPKKAVQLLEELRRDLSYVPDHIGEGVLTILEHIKGGEKRARVEVTWVSIVGLSVVAILSAFISTILTLYLTGQDVF